jgi:hypothetical protein
LAQNGLSQNDNPLMMMFVDLVTIPGYFSSFDDYLQHLEVFQKPWTFKIDHFKVNSYQHKLKQSTSKKKTVKHKMQRQNMRKMKINRVNIRNCN